MAHQPSAERWRMNVLLGLAIIWLVVYVLCIISLLRYVFDTVLELIALGILGALGMFGGAYCISTASLRKKRGTLVAGVVALIFAFALLAAAIVVRYHAPSRVQHRSGLLLSHDEIAVLHVWLEFVAGFPAELYTLLVRD